MQYEISKAIKYKLNYLNLTRAGKIRLSVFNEKVIYKTNTKFYSVNNGKPIPENAFNLFFAIATEVSHSLGYEPQWDLLAQAETAGDLFQDSEVTEDGEKFDMQLCNSILVQLQEKEKRVPEKKRYGKQSNSSGAVTFDRGVKYWKHGNWYAYPDQALNNNTSPCKEDYGYIERPNVSWEERGSIDPKKELLKAIKSGRLNMQGLIFLRNTFIKDPELLKIIDLHLAGKIDTRAA